MKPRTAYSIRKNGRHFTKKRLEEFRFDLCEELRKTGKDRIADRYIAMTIEAFAAQGGYVIVKR